MRADLTTDRRRGQLGEEGAEEEVTAREKTTAASRPEQWRSSSWCNGEETGEGATSRRKRRPRGTSWTWRDVEGKKECDEAK